MMTNWSFVCYNFGMRKLYYATFENGLGDVVKQIIKKIDRNTLVKTLYDDAVLFYADEHFAFTNTCFKTFYLVLDDIKKEGVGAINAEMKHLLEKKGFKISFPKEVSTFKFIIQKEKENVLVDSKLKNAVEIMLKRITKMSISYLAGQAELCLLAKADGTTMLMKKLNKACEFSKIESPNMLSPHIAYVVNFLSEPQAGEVVLDPFASGSLIAYTRALCFKKANVIAAATDEQSVLELKKQAKSLKEKTFSVLKYEFLEDNFPIKFIDKIVTELPTVSFDSSKKLAEVYLEFFAKVFELSVKTVVVVAPKSHDIVRFIQGKYDIENQVNLKKSFVYKLKIRG